MIILSSIIIIILVLDDSHVIYVVYSMISTNWNFLKFINLTTYIQLGQGWISPTLSSRGNPRISASTVIFRSTPHPYPEIVLAY